VYTSVQKEENKANPAASLLQDSMFILEGKVLKCIF